METTEVFYYISQIAEKNGVSKINELDGLWEHKVNSSWEIKVNGHRETIDGVPPFHALVIFNGWSAGLVSPFGGVIANEDSFIEAMKNSIGV